MENEEMKNSLGTRNAIRDARDQGGIGKFLDQVPVKKFYEQALYIDKTLLPSIEKNRGKESADYQFFVSVFKSLLYAVAIIDRYEFMDRKVHRQESFIKSLQEQVVQLSRELQKYCTVEDIFLSEGIDRYIEMFTKRAAELLQR
jgi:hypothetical protein